VMIEVIVISILIKMPDNDFLAVSSNPTKGVIYYLIAGLFFQLNFIFAKVLYERNPALTSF